MQNSVEHCIHLEQRVHYFQHGTIMNAVFYLSQAKYSEKVREIGVSGILLQVNSVQCFVTREMTSFGYISSLPIYLPRKTLCIITYVTGKNLQMLKCRLYSHRRYQQTSRNTSVISWNNNKNLRCVDHLCSMCRGCCPKFASWAWVQTHPWLSSRKKIYPRCFRIGWRQETDSKMNYTKYGLSSKWVKGS